MLAFPTGRTVNVGGEPPGSSITTPGGMFEVMRVTFPVNPFRLNAITSKPWEEPGANTIELGEMNRLKSGVDVPMIVRDPTVVWNMSPLVPVMV